MAILAAGGGAALLGLALVANMFGGGGAGESQSPSASSAAASGSSATASGASPSDTASPSGASPTAATPTAATTLLAGGRGILVQCYTGTDTDTNSDTSEIYLYDPERPKVEKVTHNRSPDRWPRWSPDGKSVALTRLVKDAGDIWTINAADGGEDQVTRGTANDWGPDVAGGFVYFSSGRNEATGSKRNDIWRVSLTGDRTARLWFGRTGFDDKSPAWSPDGSTMAFSSNHQGRGGSSASAIFTTTADKTDERHTSGGVVDRNPTWRSDSRALLFTRNAVGGLRDIYSVDPSGGTPVRVTRDSADEGGPVYSPAGDRIAFYRKIQGDWHLLIGNLDASGVLDEDSILDVTETTSLNGKNCIDPSWR
jgi:Tol biopolymer transport system component